MEKTTSEETTEKKTSRIGNFFKCIGKGLGITCRWLGHAVAVAFLGITGWVKRAITVRDIFFFAIGFTIASIIAYFAYNLLLDSFVAPGKILHNHKVYELMNMHEIVKEAVGK